MTRATAIWLAAYGLFVAAIAGGMFYGRSVVIAEYDTPEAKAEWEKWREKTRQESSKTTPGHAAPVDRRVPKSAEPPALVLMRDYFGTCLFGALFFGSLLFGTLAVAIRGAFSGDEAKEEE